MWNQPSRTVQFFSTEGPLPHIFLRPGTRSAYMLRPHAQPTSRRNAGSRCGGAPRAYMLCSRCTAQCDRLLGGCLGSAEQRGGAGSQMENQRVCRGACFHQARLSSDVVEFELTAIGQQTCCSSSSLTGELPCVLLVLGHYSFHCDLKLSAL